jgi:hypothetical protein
MLAGIALAIGGAGLAKASTNPLATTHLAKAAATSQPALKSTTACTEPDGDPADSDTACPGTSSTSKVSGCENGEPGGDAANPDADDDCPTTTTKPKVTTTTTKPCPGNEPRVKGKCEFEGATFFAGEDPKNQMSVLVDASAVNGKATEASGNHLVPGPKVTDKFCADPVNACDAVANRDETPSDITSYHWEMIAYRQTSSTDFTPKLVEEHHFDVTGTPPNPQAAQQFTKTQGDDVVQVILTVTEGTEGSQTIAGPLPQFPLNAPGAPPAETNKNDLSPNVILEPCNNGGLIAAPSTLADTLVDGGLGAILNEPEANGALSGPIEQNTVGTPLGGLGNEVACLVNALPGGAL